MSASASVSMELAPFHNLRGKHVVGLYLLNGENVCSEKNDWFFWSDCENATRLSTTLKGS